MGHICTDESTGDEIFSGYRIAENIAQTPNRNDQSEENYDIKIQFCSSRKAAKHAKVSIVRVLPTIPLLLN